MSKESWIGGRTMLSWAAAASLCGCAVSPTHELALGERAIAQAEAAGAAVHAPAELALATEKLALGKRWIAARDYEPARWLVEQARVDAELAGMKTASAIAMRAAIREAARFRAATLRVAAHQER
jgi:Domain of unknown function (DUF4398)